MLLVDLGKFRTVSPSFVEISIVTSPETVFSRIRNANPVNSHVFNWISALLLKWRGKKNYRNEMPIIGHRSIITSLSSKFKHPSLSLGRAFSLQITRKYYLAKHAQRQTSCLEEKREIFASFTQSKKVFESFKNNFVIPNLS